MADVDRILAERRAADAGAPADALNAPPMDSVGMPLDAASIPLVGLMGGALAAALPPRDRIGGVILNAPGSLPVPPADIPNPGQ
jgi:hypothetical protein